MRRHAHHGAVAMGHQHVVADPDLDLLAGDGVGDEQACGRPSFLRGELGLGGATLLHSSMKAASGFAGCCVNRQWVLGATAQKVTPMMVSARVVNTLDLTVVDLLPSAPVMSCANAKRTPQLLPISFPASGARAQASRTR